MQKPLVSIVTPSFNQGQFIERTIRSVLRQDYGNIEYIVIDAISTDETTEILRKYSKEISIVVQEKDNGQSDALNKGFELSSGKILAYLNADDCFSGPGVVSDAVSNFLSTSRGADVVYGRRYRITGEGFFLDSYPFRPFDPISLTHFNTVPQECAFWSRDIWAKAGSYFRTDLHFCMDYELWLRFLQYGASFLSVDQVYGYFRWHSSQKSQSIWRDVCLPEVAKIQREYVSRATSTGDMEQRHESFFYGVDLNAHPRLRPIAMKLWRTQLELSRGYLTDTPLDYWVFAA